MFHRGRRMTTSRCVLAFLTAALTFFSRVGVSLERPKIESKKRTQISVKSPDGKVAVSFATKDRDQEKDCLFYNVTYKGDFFIVDSRLGLELKNAPALEADFRVVKVFRKSHDSVYSPVYGERNAIRDYYNEVAIDLIENGKPHRALRLTFRAYNEGIAFRYTFPEQQALGKFVITSENTHFRFADNYEAYEEHGTEGEYKKVFVRDIKPNCERPLTIETGDGPVGCLMEACLDNYARMLLSPAKGQPNTLVSSLSGPVTASPPFSTPWRVIVLGDKPGDLIERNYLILNLNPPCAIEDASWIRPGKVIREVTLSTRGGKACIDFASKHNIQYVEFDAGWYGPENSPESDASTVTPDPRRADKSGLNLPLVISYAKEHGVGILLYVNRRALESQLDRIMPLYEKWGIKGVKFGFVRVGSQDATDFVHRAVRKAARHRLMVDIHDAYRPTGFSRTYPNLMTQEGVRGNEHMPTAEHNVTLPFTRFVAGAADCTICYYNKRIKTTHAHQLATAVVFYSPLQFCFWYDTPSLYRGEKEIEFFEHVPTVWDDTKVIHGRISDYITVARRSGREWCVGSLTDENARELEIPLTFLDNGEKYVAHVYSDAGPEDTTRTHVAINRYIVDFSVIMRARMASSGGQAIRLAPSTPEELTAYPRYR